MTDTLTLGPVLDLIERWQQARSEFNLRERTEEGAPIYVAEAYDEVEFELAHADLSALRQLAEQHAAQLRRIGRDVNNINNADTIAERAANFLACK